MVFFVEEDGGKEDEGASGVKTPFLMVWGAAACTTATVHQATLSPAPQRGTEGGRPPYTAADVRFMAGMIGHHAQAVLMAGWAPSHGASPAVRVLCERIVVAQNDEIAFVQRWLREHNEFVPPADPRGDRKSTRLNSSHGYISYAVFCLKKKK